VGNVLYYQLNIDYIIETYCINKDQPELQCNGKCHLAKQLQITNKAPSDEQSSYNLVYEAFYPLFFQNSDIQFKKKSQIIISIKNWKYYSNLEDTFLYNCFQPPELFS